MKDFKAAGRLKE